MEEFFVALLVLGFVLLPWLTKRAKHEDPLQRNLAVAALIALVVVPFVWIAYAYAWRYLLN